MEARYTVVCGDAMSSRVSELARENDLTEEEVLHQLVDIGLEHLDEEKAPA